MIKFHVDVTHKYLKIYVVIIFEALTVWIERNKVVKNVAQIGGFKAVKLETPPLLDLASRELKSDLNFQVNAWQQIKYVRIVSFKLMEHVIACLFARRSFIFC